jgi:hypothetical protein
MKKVLQQAARIGRAQLPVAGFGRELSFAILSGRS